MDKENDDIPILRNPNDLNITDAALLCGVSRQAIYIAIKNGRLPAYKFGMHWFMTRKELRAYRESLYSRLNRKNDDGTPMYDNAQGKYSPNQLSEVTGIPIQRIYYLLKRKFIPSTRIRSAWIAHVVDIKKLKEMVDQMYSPHYLECVHRHRTEKVD